MRRVNNVTVSNGTMFEQDLEILFQRSNLLLARFQLISELAEGIFDFFLAHADKMMHRPDKFKIFLDWNFVLCRHSSSREVNTRLASVMRLEGAKR
jgi:hypothetical protein